MTEFYAHGLPSVCLGGIPLNNCFFGTAFGVVAGTRFATRFRPPGGPRIPADLAFTILVILRFVSISFVEPLVVLSVRFKHRVSGRCAVVPNRPVDRAGASVCAALDGPSRFDDNQGVAASAGESVITAARRVTD